MLSKAFEQRLTRMTVECLKHLEFSVSKQIFAVAVRSQAGHPCRRVSSIIWRIIYIQPTYQMLSLSFDNNKKSHVRLPRIIVWL